VHINHLQLKVMKLVLMCRNYSRWCSRGSRAFICSVRMCIICVYVRTLKQLEKVAASSAVRLRRDSVTLNFDLLTPKCNKFISVPRCSSDKSLAKIRQQILEISRKHKTTTWITDGRTDRQRHGRTTRKHIASAGAYWRRRLKKSKDISTPNFAGG